MQNMLSTRFFLKILLLIKVGDFVREINGAKSIPVLEWTLLDCSYRDLDLIADADCWLNRVSKSKTTMNAFFVPAEDIHNLNGTYRVALERTGKYVDYIKVKLDLCDALGQVHNNLLLDFIARELRAVSNFPLTCPFKKNTRYEVTNFTVDSKILPRYTPDLNWATYAGFWVSGKQVLRLHCFGTIRRK